MPRVAREGRGVARGEANAMTIETTIYHEFELVVVGDGHWASDDIYDLTKRPRVYLGDKDVTTDFTNEQLDEYEALLIEKAHRERDESKGDAAEWKADARAERSDDGRG